MADDELTPDEEPEEEPDGPDLKTIDYADRKIRIKRPTDGQIAAMARLGKSGLMDDGQRVANLLDLLEAFVVDQPSRLWLSNGLLLGTLEFDAPEGTPSALGLLYEVARTFRTEGENRAARRQAGKARRVRS